MPLQRLQTRAATNTGISSPSCAAPSGFLNLLTRYSALALLALFHARSAPGVEALRGFPLPVAATAFTARCPSSFLMTSIRDEALAPLRGATRRQRPRERYLGTDPKNDTSTPPRISHSTTLRRGRQVKDPIEGHRSSGIHASGRSVLGEVVLPDVRRPCLSQPFWSPTRTSPFKPRLCKLQGLLSWACFQRWTNPTLKTLFRVSKNPKVGLSLSRTAVLLGVFVLKAM